MTALRGLVAAYEATGRDYRSDARARLEVALCRYGAPVTVDGWVWGWDRRDRSIYRRRAVTNPDAPVLSSGYLPRVCRCAYVPPEGRPDLVEMSPESLEG